MTRVGVPERSGSIYGAIPNRIQRMLRELHFEIVAIPVGARPAAYVFDSLMLTGGPEPNPWLLEPDQKSRELAHLFDDERDTRELEAVDIAMTRGCSVL